MCIGGVAAFDMEDENAIISPGGIGFDINCGVRLVIIKKNSNLGSIIITPLYYFNRLLFS